MSSLFFCQRQLISHTPCTVQNIAFRLDTRKSDIAMCLKTAVFGQCYQTADASCQTNSTESNSYETYTAKCIYAPSHWAAIVDCKISVLLLHAALAFVTSITCSIIRDAHACIAYAAWLHVGLGMMWSMMKLLMHALRGV